MASTSTDLDPTFLKCIGLLHSDDPNSATEIRLILDELIKQRFGPSKTIAPLVTKRHLELEKSFRGIAKNPPEQPTTTENTTTTNTSSADDVINLTNSPIKTISDSPDTIADSDDAAMLTMATSEEVENLKEFGDLNCCVCGEMMFTATNRLIECSQCGSLYHQECHKPAITNEETSDGKEHTWQCNTCNDKPSTSKAAAAAAAAATIIGAPATAAAAAAAVIEEPIPLIAKTKSSASSSRSSSSSNSSSPFYKQEHSSSSSSKHHKSSSSKSHREERSTSSSSSTKPSITPSINVISAPEKGSSSSKSKSSSSHSSSSKSKSSSSSSSKHHDSSSSKRKLSK